MNWDMLGHEWAVQMLQQHIQRGEVRHAYLFVGPPAVGRRTLALRFARALNCLQPPSPGVDCGVCRICRQLSRLEHADLTVIQSDGKAPRWMWIPSVPCNTTVPDAVRSEVPHCLDAAHA
jgi:DNA polymerase-3 subunit delta'